MAPGARIPTKVAAVLKLDRSVDDDDEWYASPRGETNDTLLA